MSAAFRTVQEAHGAFRAWMFDHALPFWARNGRDAPGLGVRERLTLDGQPAPAGFKRTRVQARQIYAFSHATLLGWSAGGEVAADAYGFLQRARRPEGGWVRQVDPSGTRVLDGTADLYDQAFVLFALAWYGRMTGDARPLQQARETAEWVRVAMRGPGLGYWNTLPPGDEPRQQNPHMHLLEAALALFETSGDGYWADWAAELVALFDAHLMDPATGTLGEFFTADWQPAAGSAGDHVEPGHHYEWAWLLEQYSRLTGHDRRGQGRTLYDFAQRHGRDAATGEVWDIVGRDGTVRDRSLRLWPQTEALKAHCVLGGSQAGAEIMRIVDTLLSRFFQGCPAGAWVDRFDAAGRPMGDGIPTSSFYHVFMAYAELDGFVRGAGAAEAIGPG